MSFYEIICISGIVEEQKAPEDNVNREVNENQENLTNQIPSKLLVIIYQIIIFKIRR